MRIFVAAVVTVALTVSCGGAAPDGTAKQFVTIGTGGITGVYYPTGGAIAKMVNADPEYNIRATVEATGGSVFNINSVMTGDLDFGIAQSDRQYQAVNGLAEWAELGPQKNLRAVFSIHPEAVTLVAADDAGIDSLEDLRGKRVNLGNPGSGQLQNSLDALTAAGIDPEKDIVAEHVKASEAPHLLQDGRIDAFFYTVGHPSGAFKEATAGQRSVHFVPVSSAQALVDKFPYYALTTVPVDLYTVSNDTDVPTFGVKATFVTSAGTPDDVVYAFTREVFENLDEFKTLHPAYAWLTRENMLEGLSAPLHPGALRYYQEVGLQ